MGLEMGVDPNQPRSNWDDPPKSWILPGVFTFLCLVGSGGRVFLLTKAIPLSYWWPKQASFV